MSAASLRSPLGYGRTSAGFVLAALAALVLADIHAASLDPWADLRRLLGGLIRPDFAALVPLSIAYTVAFAVLGVGLGAGAGFLLAIPFARSRAVRLLCASLRAVHELFWALLLMQVFGLSATTGLLAIALPYAGICAKVFSEIIEEADLAALRVLPPGTGAVSSFLYARLPDVAANLRHYTLYRFECGLRSTLVLGFVGLPTMGFHLESAFRQGRYGEAAALLAVFYVLIGTRRLWVRPATLPFLSLASLLVLPATLGATDIGAGLARFLTHSIVPAPLRDGALADPATWARLWAWFAPILIGQNLPDALETLVLAQIALVATALGALVLFPLTARRFTGPVGRPLGRGLLVVVRSTPEYMLAYLLLQFLGPSMLPAILALAIHNAGIVGYLMGRHADGLAYRLDAAQGPESLRLRDAAAALRAVPGLSALPLGADPARERDPGAARRRHARLLRRCGNQRAAHRRGGGAHRRHGDPDVRRRGAVALAAEEASHRHAADPAVAPAHRRGRARMKATTSQTDPAARPPSVDRLLAHKAARALTETYGRSAVTDAIRAGETALASSDELLARAAHRLERENRPSLRPVLKLTGTVLHTNLGRAPLPPEAAQPVAAVMRGASNSTSTAASGASATTMSRRWSAG